MPKATTKTIEEKTTEQVSTKVKSPKERNPSGKGGFGDHPENRNPGGWDKTGSISYQYNRFIRMTDADLAIVEHNSDNLTIAMQIALARVKAAKNEQGGLMDTKEITDRTEGKASQAIDVTTGGEKLNNVALVQFIDADKTDTSTDTE